MDFLSWMTYLLAAKIASIKVPKGYVEQMVQQDGPSEKEILENDKQVQKKKYLERYMKSYDK